MTKSLSKEELGKQIAAKQQELQTLQLATQKAQDEWDAQRKQIASDTEVTIAAAKAGIAEELKEAHAELQTVEKQVAAFREAGAINQQEITAGIDALKLELSDLERDKKVLQTTNSTLAQQNLELDSQISVAKESILDLRGQETALSEKITDMRMEEIGLKDNLEDLQNKVDDKSVELNSLISDFDTTEDEQTRRLAILEAKRDAVAQEIIQNKAEDEKVRDNLADWAKKLEEKEKNLSIREAQVNMQQKTIARNANLLNL